MGEVGLFSVDCFEVGFGVLDLEVVFDSGAKVEVCIENNKDGIYAVIYVFLIVGMYTLIMKYGGEFVLYFFIRVKVEFVVDISRVKVFGLGIEGKGGFNKKEGGCKSNMGFRGFLEI